MPELRKDPIIGRWVIISTERAKRPDDFKKAQAQEPPEEGVCPFCRGREHLTPPSILNLPENAEDWQVRVVPSIRPLLRIEDDLDPRGIGMYDILNGVGAHEVIIETPQHIADIADLSIENIFLVLESYKHRLIDLEKDERLKYVLIYKNQGWQAGGGRTRHSRSQLIATPVNPKRVKEELVGSRHYYDDHQRCIFCDIIRQEREQGIRLVYENEHTEAVCPFASRFPFEVWILPQRHCCDFYACTDEELMGVARALKIILSKIKQGLNSPAYNYVLHTSPFRRPQPGYWTTILKDYHWHIEITPRLTRVAGFEWGSGFYICPTPPEEAAKFLKEFKL